ncbi:MAG: hypothetical protein ACREUE_00410 [Panacagrimonas sp.]
MNLTFTGDPGRIETPARGEIPDPQDIVRQTDRDRRSPAVRIPASDPITVPMSAAMRLKNHKTR